MRWTAQYHVACKLQDRILEHVGIVRRGKGGRPVVDEPDRNLKVKPMELAALVKAWDVLEDRKRVIRMKPVPRPIDVTKEQKKTGKPASFIE